VRVAQHTAIAVRQQRLASQTKALAEAHLDRFGDILYCLS
jgi:hypothetical protein